MSGEHSTEIRWTPACLVTAEFKYDIILFRSQVAQ